jgi:hypothetical protein
MGCELALKNRRWIEFGHVKERGWEIRIWRETMGRDSEIGINTMFYNTEGFGLIRMEPHCYE